MRLAQPLLHLSAMRTFLNWACMTFFVSSVALTTSAFAKSAFGYGDAVIDSDANSQIKTTAPRTETFRGLDKNRDGALNRSEMRTSPRYEFWRVIDRNHDGKVSAREYSDFRAHREHGTALNSAGATENPDYGDPYLNSRLRTSPPSLKKGSSETGPESESHYEEVLRKSTLERERRKNPAGY